MDAILRSPRALWSLVFSAGDVWTAVTWIWGSGVDVLDHLGPAEYATAIFIFTGLLVCINYAWLNARRPAVRFKGQASAIESIIRKSGTLNLGFEGQGELLDADRKALRHNLAGLGIALPANHKDWPAILPDLLAYAQTGQLAAARKLCGGDQS